MIFFKWWWCAYAWILCRRGLCNVTSQIIHNKKSVLFLWRDISQWTATHGETSVRGRTTAVHLQCLACQTERGRANKGKHHFSFTHLLYTYFSIRRTPAGNWHLLPVTYWGKCRVLTLSPACLRQHLTLLMIIPFYSVHQRKICTQCLGYRSELSPVSKWRRILNIYLVFLQDIVETFSLCCESDRLLDSNHSSQAPLTENESAVQYFEQKCQTILSLRSSDTKL